jgi:hypothetical protein
MSIFSIIKPLSKRAWYPISTAIAAIRRLKELRANLGLITITVLCTLGACDVTHFLSTHRCRTFGCVFKYAFISELAFASGRFAFASYVSLYFTAYASTVLTCSISYPGKTLAKSKSSLDEQSFVICKVFHDGSFPAGYRCNCS